MYAKLENNILKYAPHYLILNGKTILNPQDGDYKNAGYKELVYTKRPDITGNKRIVETYSEGADKITVNYAVEDFITEHTTPQLES